MKVGSASNTQPFLSSENASEVSAPTEAAKDKTWPALEPTMGDIRALQSRGGGKVHYAPKTNIIERDFVARDDVDDAGVVSRFERCASIDQRTAEAIQGRNDPTIEGLKRHVLLEGEKEQLSLRTIAVKGGGFASEDKVGHGAIMLSCLAENSHRLHYVVQAESAVFSCVETATRRETHKPNGARISEQGARLEYFTEHHHDGYYSTLKVEGDVHQAHAEWQDVSKSSAHFKANAEGWAVGSDSCCMSLLRMCIGCAECYRDCMHCKCVKCTGGQCKCFKCRILCDDCTGMCDDCCLTRTTEYLSNFTASTGFVVNLERMLQEIDEAVSTQQDTPAPPGAFESTFEPMAGAERRLSATRRLHCLHLVHRALHDNKLKSSLVFIHPDESVDKVMRFASMLGALCVPPPAVDSSAKPASWSLLSAPAEPKLTPASAYSDTRSVTRATHKSIVSTEHTPPLQANISEPSLSSTASARGQ